MDLSIAGAWGSMGCIGTAVVIALLLLSVWLLYIAIKRRIAFNKTKKEGERGEGSE